MAKGSVGTPTRLVGQGPKKPEKAIRTWVHRDDHCVRCHRPMAKNSEGVLVTTQGGTHYEHDACYDQRRRVAAAKARERAKAKARRKPGPVTVTFVAPQPQKRPQRVKNGGDRRT